MSRNYRTILNTMTVAFEPEYIAVLDRMVAESFTLPAFPDQVSENLMVKRMKDEGIWNELDLFYWFKRPAALADCTRINWKKPSSFLLTSPVVPTFINNFGWQGGGNAYWNTNYTPSVHAVKGLPGNISVFYHQFGFTNAASAIWGTRNSSGNNFAQSNASCILHGASLAGTGGYTLDTDILHVKNGTTHNKYGSGSLINTASYASGGALSTVPLVLLGQNLNGTISQFVTTSGLKYFGIGSKNIESKSLKLYQILNNII